jgi:transcription factor C subunit 7
MDRGLPLPVRCCTVTELTRKGDDGSLFGRWEATRLVDGEFLKNRDSAPNEWSRGFRTRRRVEAPGVPGTEGEVDDSCGSQVQLGQSSILSR